MKNLTSRSTKAIDSNSPSMMTTISRKTRAMIKLRYLNSLTQQITQNQSKLKT